MTKTAEPSGVSDARFRALFDHVPVGVVLADASSRYIDANPSACQMLGYSHDEFVGLSAKDIVVSDDQSHISPALAEIHNRSVHRREWRFRRKNGTIFSADVIATILPDGFLIGIVDDISDKQRAEEYREHFAAIVESSLDAIVGKDLNGIVTSWNAAASTIFGYTAEEIIGQPYALLIPEYRADEERIVFEKLLKGEPTKYFYTVRKTKHSSLIDVSVSASPIRNRHGKIVGIAKTLRDVSLLKQQEAEILRITSLYAALSQINQAIVWSHSRDALFSKVCAVLVEFGGFSMAWVGLPDERSGQIRPVAQSGDCTGYLDSIEIFGDERPEGLGPSGSAYRTGRPYISNDMGNDATTLPWRPQIRRAGFQAQASFPIRLNANVCGILSVYSSQKDFFQAKEVALLEEAATDISFALDNFAKDEARQTAEQNLRNEKNFSDTMIESMPGIVYFYDFTGRFIRWNRNFETVSGYSAGEIARMHPRDFFEGEEKDILEQKVSEVLDIGASTLEARFISKDGTGTPYFFTGSRILVGGIPCLVGVGVDITERKVAEEERERRHRAEAADHIKSAFLATMSHELRTPLNSIIGFTGIMLQGLAGPFNAEQKKQLGMVRGSARHLLALVNDVLDVSKIEAGQLDVASESFDIERSIAHVVELVSPLADAKGLNFEVSLQPGLGEAVSDARRFEQMLLNLLSNAIKFTDTGGVSVSADLIESCKSAEASNGKTALRVRITDTGIGIKPSDLGTLFEPFRQIETGLSRQREGTGLGLAICHRLALLMGGKIQVESEFGRGSVFTLILPVRE